MAERTETVMTDWAQVRDRLNKAIDGKADTLVKKIRSRQRLLNLLEDLNEEMESDPDRRFIVKTKTPFYRYEMHGEKNVLPEWRTLRGSGGLKPQLYTLNAARVTVEAFRKLGVDARIVGADDNE